VHIACDPDSRSEIVLPVILEDGSLFGVFDVDSAELGRFGSEEKEGLKNLNDIIIRKIRYSLKTL